MALSGLDIYKLLPKTNCRECGFATCLAFAMQLAKKAVGVDKCPFLSEDVKKKLAEASLPPIKLVTLGEGAAKIEVGNETVLFRHEEKFYHPCALGFILEDTLPDEELKNRLDKIGGLEFERVGQKLEVSLLAIKQTAGKEKFLKVLNSALRHSKLTPVLISEDAASLREAAGICKERRPLLYAARQENLKEIAAIAKEFSLPVAACAEDLDKLSELTAALNGLGVKEIILDTANKAVKKKIWDFTQIRRQALKKANRSLGYPLMAVVDAKGPYEEALEASAYICKYASILLLSGIESWEILSLLTLRQNIYTDPQKPLQIEPKLYAVGQVSDKTPVLVTTNFSLTYYTVLGEVEASKVPAYIVSVDTEGMSVLTAWAAEKFTPEKISDSLVKFGVRDKVAHNRLIIPGYVAVISGDLEEKSGCEIIVGPKEAAGIPAFLKKL